MHNDTIPPEVEQKILTVCLILEHVAVHVNAVLTLLWGISKYHWQSKLFSYPMNHTLQMLLCHLDWTDKLLHGKLQHHRCSFAPRTLD